jgi:hypothetical protein
MALAVGHEEVGQPLADGGNQQVGVAGLQAFDQLVISGFKIGKNPARVGKVGL